LTDAKTLRPGTKLAMLGVTLLLATTAAASDWHVLPRGDDSHERSEQKPFANIERAVQAATQAGDEAQIVLHPGALIATVRE
jgi:hypothetical protein